MFKKKLLGLGLGLLLLAVIGGFIGDFMHKFNNHRNRLHLYILNGDAELAKAEFNNLKYFDKTARDRRLGWFANRYLLNNDLVALYDGAIDYSVGDYGRVANSAALEQSGDYRAAHMIGSAKVRILQGRYRDEKNPAGRQKMVEELADEMVKDISPYFKKAVQLSPPFKYPDPNFNDRWNYDITSDKNSAKKILQPQIPPPKFILGIPKGLDGGPNRDKEPGKRLNEQSDPGMGGQKKKG